MSGILLPNQDITHWPAEDGQTIRVCDRHSGEIHEVPLSDTKAIIFVKSFATQQLHEDLQFYDDRAEVPFLWTRVTFVDGEVIECLVPNSSDPVLLSGFFAWSVDPESNSVAMYLVKKMIKDFQVLAVRQLDRDLWQTTDHATDAR